MPGFNFDFSKVVKRAKVLFPFLTGTPLLERVIAPARDRSRTRLPNPLAQAPAGRAPAAARDRQRGDAIGDRQVVVAARSLAPVQPGRGAGEHAQPEPGAPAGAARRLRRRRTGCSRTSIRRSAIRACGSSSAWPRTTPTSSISSAASRRATRRRARPPSCCSCSTSWRRAASTRSSRWSRPSRRSTCGGRARANADAFNAIVTIRDALPRAARAAEAELGGGAEGALRRRPARHPREHPADDAARISERATRVS